MSTWHAVPQLVPRRLCRLSGGLAAPRCCGRWQVSSSPARAEVVALADRDPGRGTDRLSGELTRTTFQKRLFADVLEEGSYLEAIIDHADTTLMGPRPDL